MGATLCSMLWNHLFVSPQGETKPCCRFASSSPDWNEIRAAMLSGERVEGCRRCYEEEDAGKKSLRMRYNEHPALGLSTIRLDEPAVTWLELSFSNRCNVACRMCDSRYSTRWVRDEEALGVKPKASAKVFDLDFETIRRVAKDLRHVKVTGGEPLFDRRHAEFLRMLCAEADPGRIYLNYSTNLTLFPNEEVIELWSRFERVELALSLDSVHPEEMNYMRYPTDGAIALENTRRYRELLDRLPGLHLVLRSTVSIFNIHSIPDTMMWWHELKRGHPRMNENPTHLTFPEYLRATVMSPTQKARVASSFAKYPGNETLDYLRNFMFSADEHSLFSQFKKKTEALDRVRGQDYKTLYPHLSDE